MEAEVPAVDAGTVPHYVALFRAHLGARDAESNADMLIRWNHVDTTGCTG